MPTINKPFLLKLVLVVVALGGLLFGAHALQARRIPDALKRQADRAAEANKSEQAIHYLRQYLEFRPDDVDAQEQLAGLLRRRPVSKSHSELVFLYDRILRIDPERHHVRREALALCLRVGRFPDAAAHAEYLLKPFPNEPALWQQLGAAQTGQNFLPEARKSYEMAITLAPREALGYQRLAQLVWVNMDDPPGAKVVLDRMVAALPESPEAYLSRGIFEKRCAVDEPSKGRGAGDANRAMMDFRRVLELDPENADAALYLAEILQQGRDVPAAHAILKDVAALYPKDLRLIRSLAWIELNRGNVPAAVAVLEDGLKVAPDAFDLLVALAEVLVQQGDTTRPAEILARLEARKAPPIQVKYLKARVAMREARWPEAIALLESLRGDTVNLPDLENQLNMLLAGCHQNTGDIDAAEKAYRRVVNANGGLAQARVGLAALYCNVGRFDDAIREYEAALASPFTPGMVVAQWVRLKAWRFKTAGAAPAEWEKLEQAVVAAAPRFGPVSSEPVILLAELAADQGKLNEAVQLLRKETARRPGDTRLWVKLADAAADFAGTPAGLAVADEAQATAGDGPDVRLVRAALYVRDPGRVRPIDQLGERIDGWSEADQLKLLHGLAEVYDSTGEKAKVVAVLKRIAARRTTDLGVWMRLFERATAIGDTKTAAEARAAVARIDGASGPAAAVCDVMSATPSEAARATEMLTTRFGPSPNRADACLVLAKLKAAVGDDTEATRLTERAFLLEPTRYETARPLVARLCVTDEAKALATVRRFAADPRWAGEPFRRMIDGVLSQVPAPVAVKLLTWCEPLIAGEPDGLGWLASCYTRIGSADRSTQLLEAAVNRPGATSDDWFRLALAKGPDAVMPAAAGRLRPQSYLAMSAALAETSVGKNWSPAFPEPGQKRLYAQSRLAVKLSRSEPAEAAKVLEAFLTEKELPKPDIGWAKRNLAMLYAVGGTPDDRKRAMDLIKTAEDFGATPDELRATAGVMTTLARYLEGDDRREVLGKAVYALSEAHKKSESNLDLFHLSQVYRAAGNRAESRKCLQQLLNRDPDNIYYLVTALEELTEDGNFPAAEGFANRLRQKYPGEFRAVGAVARFECKAGRPERALAVAEGYTRAAELPAGDYLARSARVAELLDELARLPGVRGTPTGQRMVDAAVERYAAMVPARPEAAVGIAGLLGSDGRVTDGFARIAQYDRYLTKRTRAMAGLAALRSGGATEAQFATVKGWLESCLAEDPESVALRLSQAEWHALRKDVPAAAAVYEQVLAKDPRNVVALNNLAWLLAADPATAGRALGLVDRATREVGLTGELLDTRGRIRITLRQFDQAEKDLAEATGREPTGLRYFHRAVLRMAQSPPNPQEAAVTFQQAKARGLDVTHIHPADLPVYRVLEAGAK